MNRNGTLAIYLNDHLAGATAGAELARRMARSHRGQEESGPLNRIAAEIVQDRSALLAIMDSLGITVRGYKVGAAWVGEKAGRIKFNGRLFTRSPLSDLEELELLRLGAGRLDELIDRARRQADELEELRVRAADRVLNAASGSPAAAIRR